MKIIIGREEGGRRLHCVADGRSFYVGMAGSVPASVSRQHCALTVNGDTMAHPIMSVASTTQKYQRNTIEYKKRLLPLHHEK